MAPEFSTISTSFQDGILVAKLNRPTKANALDHTLWFELEDLAKWVDKTPACRVLVLSAEGKYFSAGIDFSLMMSVTGKVAPLPEGQSRKLFFTRSKSSRLRFQHSRAAASRLSQPFRGSVWAVEST